MNIMQRIVLILGAIYLFLILDLPREEFLNGIAAQCVAIVFCIVGLLWIAFKGNTQKEGEKEESPLKARARKEDDQIEKAALQQE